MRCDCGSGFGSMTSYKIRTLVGNYLHNYFAISLNYRRKKVLIYIVFFRPSATSGRAAGGPQDGLVRRREGRKMAAARYRSAISLDDAAQKTTLVRSAHRNNSKRTSKPLEEQCDEFVPLVSLRFQGVNIIDVIERNRPPENSVALEPGDLEVDFVRVLPILLRTIFPLFKGGGGRPFGPTKNGFRTCRGLDRHYAAHRHTLSHHNTTNRYTLSQHVGTPVHGHLGTPANQCSATEIHCDQKTCTPTPAATIAN